MSALVLALLVAVPAGPLVYVRPDREGQPPPEPADYELSEWAPGVSLFVFADEANLRAGPSADAAALAKLPLGTPVRVISMGERTRVQDRVDRWYRVEASPPGSGPAQGYLFGNVLTPFRFDADFDGDGHADVATAGFTAGFTIRVRFRPGAPGAKIAWVDMPAAGEGFMQVKGGQFTASLVPAREAGLPLVKIETRIEACGDLADFYVSFTAPKGRAARGRAQLALRLFGLVDPPASSTFTVHFEPKAKAAVVERRKAVDEEGEEFEVTTERFVRADGVFAPVAK